jgi:hypothetical protein
LESDGPNDRARKKQGAACHTGRIGVVMDHGQPSWKAMTMSPGLNPFAAGTHPVEKREAA